ncbi:MAG: hypothetical protein KAS64_04885, partial [Spirochaetes bacterium]|nr:hypothetical protein [Spirochaetota bacterium]
PHNLLNAIPLPPVTKSIRNVFPVRYADIFEKLVDSAASSTFLTESSGLDPKQEIKNKGRINNAIMRENFIIIIL